MSNQSRFEGGPASLMGPIGVAGRTALRVLDRWATTLSVEVVSPFSCFRPDRRAKSVRCVDAYSSTETDPSFLCLILVGMPYVSGLGEASTSE